MAERRNGALLCVQYRSVRTSRRQSPSEISGASESSHVCDLVAGTARRIHPADSRSYWEALRDSSPRWSAIRNWNDARARTQSVDQYDCPAALPPRLDLESTSFRGGRGREAVRDYLRWRLRLLSQSRPDSR